MASMNSKATTPNGERRVPLVRQSLQRARSALVGVGIFSFFINLLMLTGPLYMLQVYDRVLLSRSVETLVALTVIMAMMFAFMGFFDWIRARVLTRVADGLESDLGPTTFRRWLRAGQRTPGAASMTPTQDLGTIRQFLAGNAPSAFFDIPWVPIYIGVIFVLHPMLGWLAVAGTIVIFASALYNEITTRAPSKDALSKQRAERAFTAQAIRNADTIAALGMGPEVQSRWQQMNRDGSTRTVAAADKRMSATSFTKAFRMFIQSSVLGLGGYYAIQGVITPGAMIAGSIIMGRAMAPVQMAIGQWRGFLAARESYDRLDDFYEKAPDEDEHMKLPAPSGALTVEGITAGPPGARDAVLSNITFALQPGEGLGIFGPSASGKTTLARLMTGIWMPQRGSVRLDGATFDAYDADTIARSVGYLPQSVELLDGTIAQNISRFRADATPEAITEAARLAGVYDLVVRMPEAFDTRVGAGGVVLSGGQLQRIALARAVYGTPKLVVLDEPNANLDEAGDRALALCIKSLREKRCTVVVIAHRKSANQFLDKLLWLQDGRQVAFGPKAEVLAKLAEAQGVKPAIKPVATPGRPAAGSSRAAQRPGAPQVIKGTGNRRAPQTVTQAPTSDTPVGGRKQGGRKQSVRSSRGFAGPAAAMAKPNSQAATLARKTPTKTASDTRDGDTPEEAS